MSISSTVLDRADIRFHAAIPALQPYVGCFWVITAERGATMRTVPDGTTSIAFALPQDRAFGAYLRGPSLQPVEVNFDVPTTLIGVRLRPGVVFSLSGIPAHSMVNRRIDLHEHDAFRVLASIDPLPRTPLDWIERLQTFLLGRLVGTSVHPLIAQALESIHAAQGDVQVAGLAARCGTTERHLARVMRDWIGYGPKRYAGIVRFQCVLAQMQRVPQPPVAELAAEGGYFDQSHLTVDVGRYAGATPGRLIAEYASDFSKTHCDVPF
jgi:AraC-like DNA-binding protein